MFFFCFKCSWEYIFSIACCQTHRTAPAAGASAIFQITRFWLFFDQRLHLSFLTLWGQPCHHRLGCDPQADRRKGGGLGFIFSRICGAGPASQEARSQHGPQKAASFLSILSSATCRCFAELLAIIGDWVDRLIDLIVKVTSGRLVITLATVGFL